VVRFQTVKIDAPPTRNASRASFRSGAAMANAVVSSITQCAAVTRWNSPRGRSSGTKRTP
jgi:hypothetical protein